MTIFACTTRPGAAAASFLVLLAVAVPAAAQAPDQSATEGAPVDAPLDDAAAALDHAPVIAAPDDPGRTAPNPYEALPDAGGFNSFANGTLMAPPVVALNMAPVAPVVVEMFTSQGCSSCPPADAMLSMLAAQPDVLALSYHIDYWDYLGWADSFARPEFTARQEAYARAARERAIYTPQIIVGGHDTVLAPGPAQLNELIDAARVAAARVAVQRDSLPAGEAIELQPLSDLGGKVDILMVRYVPFRSVEVTAGENRGRRVSYSNVVVALERLAQWDGQRPLRLTVRPEPDDSGRYPGDTHHALLVQQLQPPADLPGPILAAIRLD